MPDPVENLMSYKKLESSGKILRKLRRHGLSRRPTHCLFSPRSVTPVPFLEGILLTLPQQFPDLD